MLLATVVPLARSNPVTVLPVVEIVTVFVAAPDQVLALVPLPKVKVAPVPPEPVMVNVLPELKTIPPAKVVPILLPTVSLSVLAPVRVTVPLVTRALPVVRVAMPKEAAFRLMALASVRVVVALLALREPPVIVRVPEPRDPLLTRLKVPLVRFVPPV